MDDVMQAHADMYDKLSEEYEAKVSVHIENTRQQVERFASYLPRRASVLELGCAVGLASSLMADRGLTVTGIDLSPNMIRLARERAPHANFICGDFLELGLEARFDAVFAQSFVHLFPPAQLGLLFQRIRSVLNQRGAMLVSTTDSAATSAGWEAKADYEGAPKRYRQHWRRGDFLALLRSEGFETLDEWSLVDPYNKSWMIFMTRLRRAGEASRVSRGAGETYGVRCAAS